MRRLPIRQVDASAIPDGPLAVASGEVVAGQGGASGLPAGGATGQVLKKASGADGDVAWGEDLQGGDGGAVGSGSLTPSVGNYSTSAYATKAHLFALYEDASAVAVKAAVDTVAGATYKAGILVVSGGTIQSANWTAPITVPGSGVAGDRSILTFRFAAPVPLTAGTAYTAAVVRTDGTGTTTLRVDASSSSGPSATMNVDFGGRLLGTYQFFASANPTSGLAVSATGTGIMGILPVVQWP